MSASATYLPEATTDGTDGDSYTAADRAYPRERRGCRPDGPGCRRDGIGDRPEDGSDGPERPTYLVRLLDAEKSRGLTDPKSPLMHPTGPLTAWTGPLAVPKHRRPGRPLWVTHRAGRLTRSRAPGARSEIRLTDQKGRFTDPNPRVTRSRAGLTRRNTAVPEGSTARPCR